jgi:hypothetical protein
MVFVFSRQARFNKMGKRRVGCQAQASDRIAVGSCILQKGSRCQKNFLKYQSQEAFELFRFDAVSADERII